LEADGVKKFDENSAKNGAFGLVEHEGVVSLLIPATSNGR
jgi:2,3-bisphosphoglycerate-independent phosphoglycerate mutase